MAARVIAWCLAATTGAVATIVLASRPGSPGEAGRLMQSSPTARLTATARHFVPRPPDRSGELQVPRLPEAPQARAVGIGIGRDAPPQTVLPLPPAAVPAPPADVQPVPDDEPTVDDMAGREARS